MGRSGNRVVRSVRSHFFPRETIKDRIWPSQEVCGIVEDVETEEEDGDGDGDEGGWL